MTGRARHLVVIRGNSATGKTTLARELQLAMGRGTANIGQDHFRRIVLREHDVAGGANIDLIAATVRHCLDIGYHVIVEGILVESHYGDMLRGLVAGHSGPSHVYYLDLPLEHTIERHERRPLGREVPSTKLADWFVPDDLLGLPGEERLDASLPVAELVARILGELGDLDHPLPDPSGARFL